MSSLSEVRMNWDKGQSHRRPRHKGHGILSVTLQLEPHDHMRVNTELSCSYHPINLLFCGLPQFSPWHPNPFNGSAQIFQLIPDSVYTLTPCVLSVSNSFSSAFKIYGESILSYSCPTAVYSLTAARWIFILVCFYSEALQRNLTDHMMIIGNLQLTIH